MAKYMSLYLFENKEYTNENTERELDGEHLKESQEGE